MKHQPQCSFFANTGEFGKLVNRIFEKLGRELHETKVQERRHKVQGARYKKETWKLVPCLLSLVPYNVISYSLSQLVRMVIFLLSGFTNSGCFFPPKNLPGSQCPFLFSSYRILRSYSPGLNND